VYRAPVHGARSYYRAPTPTTKAALRQRELWRPARRVGASEPGERHWFAGARSV